MMPARPRTLLAATGVVFVLASFATASDAGASSPATGPELVLRCDRPARNDDTGWEREALPIGNGRIGAMVFGQPGREHLQINEISLWTGDDRAMGAYQPVGDVRVALPGHETRSADANDETGKTRVRYGTRVIEVQLRPGQTMSLAPEAF